MQIQTKVINPATVSNETMRKLHSIGVGFIPKSSQPEAVDETLMRKVHSLGAVIPF